MTEATKLYSLTFNGQPGGPSSLTVTLPNGGRKPMAYHQDDKDAIDYPYAELTLTAAAAAAFGRQMAKYGMTLTAIEQSALAEHPLKAEVGKQPAPKKKAQGEPEA